MCQMRSSAHSQLYSPSLFSNNPTSARQRKQSQGSKIPRGFVQEKCYQYWPDQGCWTYGNIRVSVEDCIVLVDYTIRKFCVQSVRTELLPGGFP